VSVGGGGERNRLQSIQPLGHALLDSGLALCVTSEKLTKRVQGPQMLVALQILIYSFDSR
jgi:hypothetical protein